VQKGLAVKITALNDNGAYETIFDAFDGYNVNVICIDGVSFEAQVFSCNSDGITFKKFVGNEDTPTGPRVHVTYDNVEEIEVH
jgi:hypothetical protein